MKICIDARPVQNSNRVRGIGVLIGKLLQSMGQIDKCDEFVLITQHGHEFTPYFDKEERIVTVRPERPNRFNWIADHFFLPGLVRKSRADVFLATDFNSYVVSLPRAKVISFVYDVIPLIFPEVMAEQPLSIKIGWPLNFNKLAKSDHIITISAATRDDIVKVLGIPRERISVVYPGIDHGCFNPVTALNESALRRLRHRFAIEGSYFIYVGDTDWRKNLRRVLAAHALLAKDVKLLLIGKRALHDRVLHDWIVEFALEGRVVLTGFVPEEDLPPLYGGALALLFPSIYEGFGFPVAEAMACGCPVITANVSSLPEVAGGAAILVNPEMIGEIVAAMEQIITDISLRSRMSQAGICQAAKFSWDRCATEVLAVLKKVAG
ncbi:MAG: glycosyltransferase family 4 protein [Geobacteraceae bacterium]|nr:glycosyltransferase family 4 protein [Geobacteraceae bacterium]